MIKFGVFLSDIHLPESINLEPIFKYLHDLKPDIIILGGDIIDAMDLHGIDSRPASDFDSSWYERDVLLMQSFLTRLWKESPKSEIVYLEGNHEERYRRLMKKYPKPFEGKFRLHIDGVPKGKVIKWIPYGDYSSFYKLGDTVFVHGTIFPDSHAKKYALDHTPFKCIYGHLHHFQAYTTRKAFSTMSPRYAVTAGCLTPTTPDYKKGAPNQWTNGFISFTYDGKVVNPTVHLIENGKFAVGRKVYG